MAQNFSVIDACVGPTSAIPMVGILLGYPLVQALRAYQLSQGKVGAKTEDQTKLRITIFFERVQIPTKIACETRHHQNYLIDHILIKMSQCFARNP